MSMSVWLAVAVAHNGVWKPFFAMLVSQSLFVKSLLELYDLITNNDGSRGVPGPPPAPPPDQSLLDSYVYVKNCQRSCCKPPMPFGTPIQEILEPPLTTVATLRSRQNSLCSSLFPCAFSSTKNKILYFVNGLHHPCSHPLQTKLLK